MNNNSLSLKKWVLLPALAGVILFLIFYPHSSPHSGLYMAKSKHDIQQQAVNVISDVGYNSAEYNQHLEINLDRKQFGYLTKHYSFSDAKRFMKYDLLVYSWTVNFQKSKGILSTIFRKESAISSGKRLSMMI